MKMRNYALICTISATIVGSAHAGIMGSSSIIAGIQDKTLTAAVGTTDRANLASSGALRRGQGFTVTAPIMLDSVSILAESVMIGSQTLGNSVTLFITNGLGNPGDSVLFTQTYDVTADAANIALDATGAGIPTWHSFNIGVVLADPGEYFLVIGSNGPSGFKIRQVGVANTSSLTGRYAIQAPEGASVADNSEWITFPTNVLATQFFGSAVVPAPGSFALIAVSGLLMVPRRKR